MSTCSKGLLAIACGICSVTAGAQVTVYDPVANLVTIPSVSVGAASFTNVTLQHIGNYVFTLKDFTEQKPAAPGVTTYDVATGVLTMPAVKVGDATFLDVTLLNTGNFVFALQTATELPRATLDGIKALFASVDALWADGVPSSGSQVYSMNDACYRGDGRTKAWLIADADSAFDEFRLRDAYRVGAVRTNLQVLAWRERANPDGSTRREADLSYDIVYKDGSVNPAATETLISGSSAGTPGCDSAQTGSNWRFLGNQQLVGVALRARIIREARYAIGTGTAPSPTVRYRRDIRFQITDPMANAKYVVISGPGPTATVNGAVVPFSWKMVSPFLMRAAPELAGKPGNFTNFQDDDPFRYCGTAGTGVPVASIADCLTYGAPGDSWGWGYTSTPDAAADSGFASQGWVAGGVYRVDVYNDDGWKTVNGQANMTPVATYYETLKSLPYTFVEMAGSGAAPTSNDKFPRLNFGALGIAGARSNSVSATPVPMNVTWNPLPDPPDGRQFRLFQTWEYFEGLKTGTAAGLSWPKVRSITYSYPGSTATSLSWPVKPAPTDMSGKSYVEYMLQYTDRNQGLIQSRLQFQ